MKTCAAAQLPPPTVVPPVPNLNPSSSLVLPPLQQARVSPAPGVGAPLLSHYHSVCSVFRHKAVPSLLPAPNRTGFKVDDRFD